jgi:hypothetical protein
LVSRLVGNGPEMVPSHQSRHMASDPGAVVYGKAKMQPRVDAGITSIARDVCKTPKYTRRTGDLTPSE